MEWHPEDNENEKQKCYISPKKLEPSHPLYTPIDEILRIEAAVARGTFSAPKTADELNAVTMTLLQQVPSCNSIESHARDKIVTRAQRRSLARAQKKAAKKSSSFCQLGSLNGASESAPGSLVKSTAVSKKGCDQMTDGMSPGKATEATSSDNATKQNCEAKKNVPVVGGEDRVETHDDCDVYLRPPSQVNGGSENGSSSGVESMALDGRYTTPATKDSKGYKKDSTANTKISSNSIKKVAPDKCDASDDSLLRRNDDGLIVIGTTSSSDNRSPATQSTFEDCADIDDTKRLRHSKENRNAHKMVGPNAVAVDPFIRRIQELNKRTRTVDAKFRCPKNKNPGDVMEVHHHHFESQCLEIIIPPWAKPGKVFDMEVRLPLDWLVSQSVCVLCNEILPEEGEEGDWPGEMLRSPLRVCDHVCCRPCHQILNGRFCPACERPLPSLKSLELLPLVQSMDNSESIRAALLEEYLLNSEYDKDRSNSKDVVQKITAAAQNTVRVIDKHYRRASIKVHPDRFGDTFRKEFDELTKARDILRDDTLRLSYLDAMVAIACKIDERYIPLSHTMWMKKNDPENIDQSRPETKIEAGRKKAQLQLEGSLIDYVQKKPIVTKTSKQQVFVRMPVKNADQFKQNCQKVTLYGSCGNMEAAEIILKVFRKSELEISDGDIRVSVDVPIQGVWEFYWNSTMGVDDGSLMRETPKSASCRVDLSCEEDHRLLEQKEGILALAKDLTAKFQKGISVPAPRGRSKVEQRHYWLHHNIVKAVNIIKKIEAVVQDSDVESRKCIVCLRDVINKATEEQKRTEKLCVNYGKLDKSKQFRTVVAQKLECGGAEEWIASVTSAELAEKGGDPNRLYQLLTEGKKADSLSFNESVLTKAAQRADFFTEKQRKALETAMLKVSVAHAEDLQQIRAQQGRKQQEEFARKKLEMKAKALNLSFGARVFCHDLKTKTDLNGAAGIYLGLSLSNDERYLVELDRDGISIALKKENFSVWDLPRMLEMGFNQPIKAEHSPPSKGVATGDFHGDTSNVVDDAINDTAATGGACQTSHSRVRDTDHAHGETLSEEATPFYDPVPRHFFEDVFIDFKTVGQVVGKNHRNLVQIMKTTRAKIKLCKEQHSVGMVTFKVSSQNRTSVDVAVALIKDAATPVPFSSSESAVVYESQLPESLPQYQRIPRPTEYGTTPTTEMGTVINFPEASSISSAGDEVAFGSGCRKTTASGMIGGFPLLAGVIGQDLLPGGKLSPGLSPSTSPTTVASASHSSIPTMIEKELLLHFCNDHKDYLKVSPNAFVEWLIGQDILCFEDLKEACEDDSFVSDEMRDGGLKGFKKNAFLKAVLLFSRSE